MRLERLWPVACGRLAQLARLCLWALIMPLGKHQCAHNHGTSVLPAQDKHSWPKASKRSTEGTHNQATSPRCTRPMTSPVNTRLRARAPLSTLITRETLARQLYPTALASVPSGIVLVSNRVRTRSKQHATPEHHGQAGTCFKN